MNFTNSNNVCSVRECGIFLDKKANNVTNKYMINFNSCIVMFYAACIKRRWIKTFNLSVDFLFQMQRWTSTFHALLDMGYEQRNVIMIIIQMSLFRKIGKNKKIPKSNLLKRGLGEFYTVRHIEGRRDIWKKRTKYLMS